MADAGKLQQWMMRDGAQVGVYRVPAVGTRRGGLVLIQEIFGLTAHIREQCDWFAQQGYEVWAAALFDRQAPGIELTYSQDDIGQAIALMRGHSFEQAVDDVAACVEALAAAGPVFVTGYCYGGSLTWAAACRVPGISAASCYYGSRIPDMSGEFPSCPVALHFGENDPDIPVARVRQFARAHPESAVWIYPAGHGFNSDRRADYHAASAKLARDRTLVLFEGNR